MSGTTSNVLWEIPDNVDYVEPDTTTPPDPASNTAAVTVDTRFRMGYPVLTMVGSNVSDISTARDVVEDIPAAGLPAYDDDDNPVAPALSDQLADVKRALSYEPATGINFISGGSFSNYLKNNFDTRIADGFVRFQAVDQDYVPDPKNKPTEIVPGLSYLRLGKPEPGLTDTAGQPLSREDDELTDQKYKSGIGMFSDGGFDAYLKKPINMRSDEAINLVAPGYCLSTYGESIIVSYEIDDDEDIKKINSGDLSDQNVNRRIINVNSLRSTDLGWYRMIFDRGRGLNYSTSNKGDFGIGSSYGLSVGAKFDYSVAASMGVSVAGKIEMSSGIGVELGENGASFKGFSGAWAKEDSSEIVANNKISLSLSGIDTLAIEATMKVYTIALKACVAAQILAFTAYNAVLAGQADRTLTAADTQSRGDAADDTYGLKTSLDQGMTIYEVALSASAISAAAGLVLAAVQASMRRALPKDGLAPDIEISHQGIFLRYGSNGIEIGPAGVKVVGLIGGVTIGGMSVTHSAPAVNHAPMPPIIPVAPRM